MKTDKGRLLLIARFALVSLCLLAGSACGNKGALYLPEKTAKPAATETTQTESTASDKNAADAKSPQKPEDQE